MATTPAQSLQALRCPNCSAPLPLPATRGLWVCLYCNCIVQVQAEAGEPPQAALAGEVAPEVMAEVKQLVLSGQREAALERYRQAAGPGAEEAEKAIESLARSISAATIRRQQLNPFGIMLLGISALAVGALLIGGLTGVIRPVWAALLGFFPASLLLVFAPGVATELRYLKAPVAPATVVNQTYIGQTPGRNTAFYTYRVLLQVQPPSAPAFRAEIMLPVREQSLSKLKPGIVLQVKYLPGDPDSVIFDKRLS